MSSYSVHVFISHYVFKIVVSQAAKTNPLHDIYLGSPMVITLGVSIELVDITNRPNVDVVVRLFFTVVVHVTSLKSEVYTNN